ncbi:RecQ family ATP-dependent DNA helicase [Brevibacillus fulvus]|uniref:ATP-dependent DNA helicase RecQ n=1 Tax=Brevibacillus fulvus TaxID=1125967 RepID=A0A938XZC0_9BACL|nr:RecQ family ATP-dependent DNA helicase [Brevibacillus fulvus]MBM7588672.1 ATP-dependent DNA helicase RecQ [Brevibacillus fulvus]
MTIKEQRLHEALQHYYGFRTFRPGQLEIIQRVLAGRSVLGLLSTGSGKSVTYQLPAQLLPGITLVVSPLISLMVDQVQRLRMRGKFSAVYLNSSLEPAETRRLLSEVEQGRYKLVYISPEKLQQPNIQQLLARRGVSLVAVDEAHCISQWGHDFRTDYLRLPEIVQKLGNPPVLAVTATATEEVQREIARLFHIHQEDIVSQSLNRGNIAYDIIAVTDEAEKREKIIEAVAKLHGPGIVYCRTRQAVEQFVATCQLAGLDKVEGYHGGMSAMDRVLIQEQFLRDELSVIVATNAFGMGIDKPNIRYVLHYHFPGSIEEYTQEVGRIGRDGQPGYAALYFAIEDLAIHQHLSQAEYPEPAVIELFVASLRAKTGLKLAYPEIAAGLDLPETQTELLLFYAEQAGLIARSDRPPYGVQVNSGFPADAANRIGQRIERARQAKRTKLTQMVNWLQQKGCYRQALAAYFGSTDDLGYDLYCCSSCGLQRIDYEQDVSRLTAALPETNWNLHEALRMLLPVELYNRGGHHH